jgi:hypothetical protein
MTDKTFWESANAESQDLIEKLKRVFHAGNVRRIAVQNEGRTVDEFPVTAGVLDAVLAPVLAAIGAMAALLKDCTIQIERTEQSDRSMKARRLGGILCGSAIATLAACGGPTAPSRGALPMGGESASYRYYYVAGDRVDAEWQETYHAWATAQLRLQVPRKIEYYKYRTRQEMGDHTGNYNTNGFAEPARFEIHTLWPTDNHEVVHIYTALVGRPSDFFNEGIAVAFQTNPAGGDFQATFNGQQVHQACRQYLQSGTLILPLARMVQTNDFRAIGDDVLSYREAGSFVRFVIDTYGVEKTLELFRISTRDDGLATISARFTTAFGVSMDAAETAWMTMLRNP